MRIFWIGSISGIWKKYSVYLWFSFTARSLDFSEKLDEIECPVVILCGEKDTANLKAAQGMKAALPQAELHIVPDAGHEVNKCASGAIAALDSPLTKERLIALFLKGKKLAVL